MINFEFIIGLALILAVVGILLSILSSFTESKSGNSSEKRIEKLLPGINCGQCGYPGCQAYAKALADGNARLIYVNQQELMLQNKLLQC